MIAVVFFRGKGWIGALPLIEQPGLVGHIDFIRKHREQGEVIEAGPFHEPTDHVDEDLVGLALLNMESLDDARQLIDSDPVVRTNAFAYRLFPWGGQLLIGARSEHRRGFDSASDA